jgi:hypothetical protein
VRSPARHLVGPALTFLADVVLFGWPVVSVFATPVAGIAYAVAAATGRVPLGRAIGMVAL